MIFSEGKKIEFNAKAKYKKKSRAVNSIREIIEQGQAVIFYLTDFIEGFDVGYIYIKILLVEV